MYLTGVTLRIARDNIRVHLPDALELAASGRVDPGRVVSSVLDWEGLPTALNGTSSPSSSAIFPGLDPGAHSRANRPFFQPAARRAAPVPLPRPWPGAMTGDS
jgi:hypothetical protein